MADAVSTSLILRVQADLAELRQMSQELLTVARSGNKAATEVQGIGSAMTASLRSVGVAAAAYFSATAITRGLESLISGGVKYNALLEQQRVAFGTLLGSADAAEKRMKSLAAFAADTPFELPEVVQASKLLQAFTGDALSAGDGLRLVGDAAAAVGAPLEAVSMWMGRLFAALRSGQSTGEALQNLTQLGLVSGQARDRITSLQGKTLSLDQAMAEMARNFGQYAGAMSAQSVTFSGRLSTLTDNIRALSGELTKPLFDKLSAGMADANANMGNIQETAQGTVKALVDIAKWGGIAAASIGVIGAGTIAVQGGGLLLGSIIAAKFTAGIAASSVWVTVGGVVAAAVLAGVGISRATSGAVGALNEQGKAEDGEGARLASVRQRIRDARTPEEVAKAGQIASTLASGYRTQAATATNDGGLFGTDGDKDRLESMARAYEVLAAQAERFSATIIANGAAADVAAKAAADAAVAEEARANALRQMEAYTKKVKEGADEHERTERVVAATGQNTEAMLSALKANEASVNAQYDKLAAIATTAGEAATAEQRSAFLKDVELKREDEMAKITKARSVLVAKLNGQEFDLFQAKAAYGTLSEQIAAKEALQARILADTTKDRAEKELEILNITREITSLREQAAIRARKEGADDKTRAADAKVAMIEGNRFMTDREKRAAKFAIFQQEEKDLPAKLGAYESELARVEAQDPNSANATDLRGRIDTMKNRRDVSLPGDLAATGQDTVGQGAMSGVVEYLNQIPDAAARAGIAIGSIAQGMEDGIATSLDGLIRRTMTWGQALANIGTSVVNAIINAFVRMVAQWITQQIVMAVFGNSIRAAQMAAMLPVAMAYSAMWASPAALATMATYGGAALAAPAQMAIALAQAQGMALFSDGGFTGTGGKFEPAGVVHKGEIVWSQDNIRAAGGVEAVERMRVSGGGFTPSNAASGSIRNSGGAAAASGGGAAPVINMAFFDSRQSAEAWASSQEGQAHIVDVVQRNLQSISGT